MHLCLKHENITPTPCVFVGGDAIGPNKRDDDDSSSVGVAVGVSVAIVIIVVALVLAVLFFRRRYTMKSVLSLLYTIFTYID